MRILTAPMHFVRKQRARRRQVLTVLHLLSASGVIRHSYIEPRYFEHSSQIEGFYRQKATRHTVAPTPLT